jgi:hypothetical protein
MNDLTEINGYKKTARIAGLWYLVLAIPSAFSWMYITKIFIPNDAVLTVQNILTTEFQYLIAILSNIVAQIGFIFLVLILYRLLKKVNEFQAKLMVILVLVSVPIMFINVIFQSGAIAILNRANYIKILTSDQIVTYSTLFIHIYIIGVQVVDIFWGLWLFPFGYLIYKSNFIPKVIGILLFISGLGYIISSITYLIIPNMYTIIQNFISIPESIGEVVILLWLLIKGISKIK